MLKRRGAEKADHGGQQQGEEEQINDRVNLYDQPRPAAAGEPAQRRHENPLRPVRRVVQSTGKIRAPERGIHRQLRVELPVVSDLAGEGVGDGADLRKRPFIKRRPEEDQ